MSCTLNKGDADGCKDLKECVQINNELDNEINRIKRLKQKYNLNDYADVQQMYMINPNKDCYQSRHVKTDPMMYMFNMSPESRCDDALIAQAHNRLPKKINKSAYRINPNAGDDFSPDEEEFVLLPNSNTPVRKRDLKERSQIRIYPHMFPSTLNTLNTLNTEMEGDSNKIDIGRSLGGVDYPIPMRHQLRYVQDRGHNDYRKESGGVDYDLRLKRKNNKLPHPVLTKDLEMRMEDNVDYSFGRRVNNAITDDRFSKQNTHASSSILRNKRLNAQTVGAPGANRKDLTCSQMIRNLKQSNDIAKQPIEWYRDKFIPESSFYTDCDGCPKEQRNQDRQADLVKPMSRQEKQIFGKEVDRRRPAYQKYPSEAAMKTSFFGLGPAIPPPNPLLLSNVPSNLLLSRRKIIDPEERSVSEDRGLQVQLTDTDQMRGTDTRPFDPSIGSNGVETFVGEGPFDQQNVLGIMGRNSSGQATPRSEFEARIRPAPTNVFNRGQQNEYSRRNKALETDLQDKINKVVEQQRQIMMQISDLRHLVPELKQRELLAKDQSNIQDIHVSIKKFGSSMYQLNQIRQLQSFLQKQQKRLMQRLEDVMPATEFLKYKKKLDNRIGFYQNEIKRYHEMPATDEIQAFTDVHFGGDTHKMKKGFYDHPHVGGLGNNALKSLKIGKNVSVILYNRPRKGGKVLVYHGPRRIPNIPVLWSTNISGIEIIDKITIQVQLFDAPFYQGGKVRVGPGFYDYPDVGGIGQAKLKSLIIPQGLHVRIYSRPNKKGETIDFLGPQRLSFLPSGWSKKVFGVEVLSKKRDY